MQLLIMQLLIMQLLINESRNLRATSSPAISRKQSWIKFGFIGDSGYFLSPV